MPMGISIKKILRKDALSINVMKTIKNNGGLGVGNHEEHLPSGEGRNIFLWIMGRNKRVPLFYVKRVGILKDYTGFKVHPNQFRLTKLSSFP